MPTVEIGEWIKWFVIILVAIIMAWEKAKRWHFKRNGKDRRKPNPHPDIGYKLSQLCQAFKDHEKHDDQRTTEIKNEIQHIREEQSRHTASIGMLKGRMNSR